MSIAGLPRICPGWFPGTLNAKLRLLFMFCKQMSWLCNRINNITWNVLCVANLLIWCAHKAALSGYDTWHYGLKIGRLAHLSSVVLLLLLLLIIIKCGWWDFHFFCHCCYCFLYDKLIENPNLWFLYSSSCLCFAIILGYSRVRLLSDRNTWNKLFIYVFSIFE